MQQCGTYSLQLSTAYLYRYPTNVPRLKSEP
ncbi:MAG: hypothetical protein JWP89_617 [Schlesneria sp.]|nr:hypothetical protein [Schlesneria sp.]